MSFFNTWLVMASALMAPEKTFLDRKPQWHPVNQQQEYFVHRFKSIRREVPKFSKKMLQALASTDHMVLNQYAAEHNIPINFQPFDAGEFGTLAVMNVQLAWHKKPLKTSMHFAGTTDVQEVKALEFGNTKVYTTPGYEHPIVKIKTKSGDYVCMTIADEVCEADQLATKINDIRRSLAHKKRSKQETVIAPEISYEGFIDVSWLKGLYTHTSHGSMFANDMQEYLQLSCNVDGCSVKAGLGIHFVPLSVAPKAYIINQPFYFWVERKGFETTIVEGYIDQDCLINN